MTLAFWDSSAFVKLLVEEVGSADAERVWNEAEAAVASRLVVPEVSAALAAARRSGRLDASAYRRSLREWGRRHDEVEMVELTPAVASEAAELTRIYPLSAADAVHLASALLLGEASPLLVTWDRRLGSAATSVGLSVAPGETSRPPT